IPNLIVPGVKEALQKTSAKIYFTINIMTKFGETHNFTGKDFVINLENRLGRKIDGIIVNKTKPIKKILDNYLEQKSQFVAIDTTDQFWDSRETHMEDCLDINSIIVRHAPKKLARVVQKIISKN
ncbi:MAG: hypothetical protein GY857_14690, partial [Desulfobacula sp.]|nr:hypothetical protein [Desulfobacula sp.]